YSAAASSVYTSPVVMFLIVNCSSLSFPLASITSREVQTEILSTPLIWSIRYDDMVYERLSFLIRIFTCLANFDKYIAACPAEFPPPTIKTTLSLHADASVLAAP